ncbi:MAG: 1-phosphofructokinase family hexose kinase [Candidatus Acidiferrales bacterium]
MVPSKIVCVSANPAMDRRVYMDTLVPGEVNRARSSLAMPGGKAAHVAMAAQALGVEASWIGFLGGAIGEQIESELRKLAIEVSPIRTAAETRVNLEVIENSGRITEVLEPGGKISPHEQTELLRLYTQSLSEKWKGALVAISGSLPPGLSGPFCGALVDIAKKAGSAVFLDTSGDALKTGLAVRPNFVKPNRKEVEVLLGRALPDLQTVVAAAREIISRGAGSVAITLGADGLVWLESKDGPAWLAQPPKLKAISTVGCGDTTLAGFAYAALQGLKGEEALKFATACGAANCLAEFEGRISPSDVQSLIPEVIVKSLP